MTDTPVTTEGPAPPAAETNLPVARPKPPPEPLTER
jgi:hypothetical protein